MGTFNSFTRRRVLIAGGTAAVAATAVGGLGLDGGAICDTGLVSVGCCPIGAGPEADGRVICASRGARSLPAVGGRSHVVGVVAFHPAHAESPRDLGDFANSALWVQFPTADGTELPAVIWGCSADVATSAAGATAMEVPGTVGGRIPLSLELRRMLGPLARRMRGVGRRAGDESLSLEQRLELPRRSGFYFVGGRRAGSGTLPSWDRCRVRRDTAAGAPTLVTAGLGEPRPVDFPYLVLRIDDARTAASVTTG